MSVIYDILGGVSWQLDHFWTCLTGDTEVGSGRVGANASSFRTVVYLGAFHLFFLVDLNQSDKELALVPKRKYATFADRMHLRWDCG